MPIGPKRVKSQPRRKPAVRVAVAKKAVPKKEPVKAPPVTVFLPQQVADRIVSAAASKPKSDISLSMRELLYGKPEILIVKAVKGGITNKQEFIKEMEELNFKVVFLEHSFNTPYSPVIERYPRPKAGGISDY